MITSTVNSKNSATYTIYSTDENKDYLKKSILAKNDVSSFNSLISGNREVVFKPLTDVNLINTEESFYVFVTKENVEILRSKTIDKYGMSKPEENHYANDTGVMRDSAEVSVILIRLFF